MTLQTQQYKNRHGEVVQAARVSCYTSDIPTMIGGVTQSAYSGDYVVIRNSREPRIRGLSARVVSFTT